MKRPSPRGLAWSACLVGSIAASTAHAQLPQGKHAPAARVARAARSFSLFGALGATGVRVDANRVDCNGLTDHGNACAGGSGTVEGAFWPAGTQDNYVYQGGLQVGALVPGNAGFGWAGDTVGVYFVDARGAQVQSSTVTGIFDSRNANDLAAWPTAALANDPSLFNAALIGRQAVSDQDTWVRYWDGNPALSVGRRHMMGLVVDQRSLAWNRPFHQDVLYFIYRLINVTSRRPQSYAGLAAAGYSAADRQQLAALGAQFQDSAKGREPALVFPDSGYVFRNLYVGYFQDPDVGIAADHNYSTAVLPFSLVAAMKTNYAEPMWQYPPAVFGSPSYRAPGYEAVQFLRSAVDSAGRQVGISVWSNTTGAGILTDPVGVSQLYRYLTGHPSPSLGDGTCNVLDAIRLHTCVALQAYADTRYWESTGPTDLGPGQSMVIAVAMLFAAPVAQWAATTNGIYAMPAGTLQAYINGNSEETFLPGWPALPETLAVIGTAGGSRVCTTACNNAATIRDAIERPMGWGQFSDANGDGRIEAGEVQTVPGSLLHKAQVAQALFDNKFLLPMAPDAPTFYLVPGDGQVTVVWQKSLTETVCTGCGDPYFPVASAPLEPDGSPNPLYDPDYRQYDVEGYRIWRGTSVANLRVVAQFDYAGTQLTDYTGQGWDTLHLREPVCARARRDDQLSGVPARLPARGRRRAGAAGGARAARRRLGGGVPGGHCGDRRCERLAAPG